MDSEVLILETAGAFGHEDYAKTAFDNSKDMFALLSMLETIADQYTHTLVEKFGYRTRLWSMQYAKNGLYDFFREEKILLSEDFSNRQERLVALVNFFLNLKSRLEEIGNTVAALKGQHDENEKYYDSENNSQTISLSDIICPRIFQLSYNTHGQHISKEHLMNSPGSD